MLSALVVLAAMASGGMAVLWRWRTLLGLAPLEVIAFGGPLGVVCSSLGLLALAIVFGFSPAVVILAAGLSFLLGAVLLPGWFRSLFARSEKLLDVVAISHFSTATGLPGAITPTLTRVAVLLLHRVSIVPTLVIGAFVVRWAVLWAGAWTYGPDGLTADHVNLWGSWAPLIGDVNAFAYGDNFPPEDPRFAGLPYADHYLASFTAAAMVTLGMDATQALALHSFLFSCLIALGVYAFARRLSGDCLAAVLGLTLFFLGGGLGWLLVAADVNGSHGLWQVLRARPWNGNEQAAANFSWHNVYFALIEPQRAYLYGLPLCLLVFTLLHTAVQPAQPAGPVRSARWREWRVFATAGAVAGLLPFSHLEPLPLLAMVCLALVTLFPSRGWIAFGVVWVALTVPQLLVQGGGDETVSSLSTRAGWMAAPDPWWWFWLKNLGWFIPLLITGFLDQTLLSPVARRFLWAFMPVFVVANLYVFQPDAWDNVKLLVYWYLASSVMVGAVLSKAWRVNPNPAVRTLVAGVTLSLILSGVLVNLHQAEGHDRLLLLTPEELEVAARVRDETPIGSLIATGLQHNHPVPIMSGRNVVMGYPGWLWPRGIESGSREQDLRAIYALAPNAADLIAHYGIDYVVIGPWERDNFAADPALWRPRYPVVIETPNYVVFEVS